MKLPVNRRARATGAGHASSWRGSNAMGRKRLELTGFENEYIRVIRPAEGDEVPAHAGRQCYWIVQCKTCENVKAKKASVVIKAQGCASCRAKRMNANRDPELKQKGLRAWPKLVRGVQDKDLDAIEEAVKVLRRYEKRFVSESK